MNIHYGDVLIKFGDITSPEKDIIPYITAPSKNDGSLLQDGDLIIADTAEDSTVGKATEIFNLSGISMVSGLHTIPCRPKIEFAPMYLGYYTNSHFYHDQLIPLMQGIKVLSISKGNIGSTKIAFPTSLKEQNKIARVFTLIDSKIHKQQELISHLKKYKRGLQSHIFNQHLADNVDWVSFEQLFKAIPDKAYQVTTSEYFGCGEYEVVDQGKKAIVGYNNSADKVFSSTPIIVYGDHTTIIKYRQEPFIVGGDGVKLLKTETKNDLYYLYYALDFYNIKPEGYKRHFSIVKNIDLPVPSLERQKEISTMLSYWDTLITKQEVYLEKLCLLKQSFLQKLFI